MLLYVYTWVGELQQVLLKHHYIYSSRLVFFFSHKQ